MFIKYELLINSKCVSVYCGNNNIYFDDNELSKEEVNFIYNKFSNEYCKMSCKSKMKNVAFNIGNKIIFLNATVVILNISLLGYDLLPNIIQDKVEYPLYSVINNNEDRGEYNYEEIVSVLNNNSKLTDEEREFLITHIAIFENNKEYINFNVLLKNLSELHFVYYPYGSEESLNFDYAGMYTHVGTSRNRIVLSGTSNYLTNDITDSSYGTIIHELLHLIGNDDQFLMDYVYYYDIFLTLYDNMFFEGLTERFAMDYVENRVNRQLNMASVSYNDLVALTIPFEKIVGEDVLRKTYFTKSYQPIVEELMKLDDDSDKAFTLFDNIRVYGLMRESCYGDGNYELSDSDMEKFNIATKDIYNSLSDYYEIKYGESMDFDGEIVIALYGTLFNHNPHNDVIKNALDDDMYDSLDFGFYKPYYILSYYNNEKIGNDAYIVNKYGGARLDEEEIEQLLKESINNELVLSK